MTSTADLGDYLRCASRGSRRRRCQLLVGHDGQHAAMAIVRDARAIVTWDANRGIHRESTASACQFAWSPGFPNVADDLAAAAVTATAGLGASAGVAAPATPRHLNSVAQHVA